MKLKLLEMETFTGGKNYLSSAEKENPVHYGIVFCWIVLAGSCINLMV